MNKLKEKLKTLEIELNNIQYKQATFGREIDKLRSAIELIKSQIAIEETQASINETTSTEIIKKENITPSIEEKITIEPQETIQERKENIQNFWENRETKKQNEPLKNIDLEKFIGENLVSKIGIIILILGVGIGVKYSIDHNLISPTMRLVLGYILGIGLLGIGLKLKEKYEKFSAVLVSGSMATNYLITYFGYSFYHLIPIPMTFIILLLLTIFTVITAIKYNQSIIANIGFLGAFGIPFLLSTGSNNYIFLFSYVALINGGILSVSYFKSWKSLFIISFILTWFTFLFGSSHFRYDNHHLLGLLFASIYFFQFYIIFIINNIKKKEMFVIKDIIPIISNSSFYYYLGYDLLDDEFFKDYLGLFTIIVGIFHFVASYIIKKYAEDKNLFYLPLGLVFVFITIAIPVQLDGNPVQLMWLVEAGVLFYLARKKSIEFYEFFVYPLLFLGVLNYINDANQFYSIYYNDHSEKLFTSILNVEFMSSIIISSIVTWISILNLKTQKEFKNNTLREINSYMKYILPIGAVCLIYVSFFFELNAHFDKKIIQSYYSTFENHSLTHYINRDYIYLKKTWILNYSIVFALILFFIERKYIHSKITETAVCILSNFILILFLTVGLYNLGELAFSYINDVHTPNFENGISNIFQRYISYGLITALLFTISKNLKNNALDFLYINNKHLFHLILATTLLWILSSELVIWMDITHFSQSFKLILSILWGIYAVGLIVIGISKQLQHIRIGALTLFSITLVKLFFYDIAHLDTISKTIVFLTLGILLLITSFLYNKFKHRINDNK